MEEFVSESIVPLPGAFDTHAMATGLPGLPRGFVWRDAAYPIHTVCEAWKQSGPEVGRLAGERYLRRHYFRLEMADGAVWTVYFTRRAPSGGSASQRWFLYSVDR